MAAPQAPVACSPSQMDEYLILWKTFSREVIHIHTASEDKINISPHAQNFGKRLHSFFATFLQARIKDANVPYVKDLSSLRSYEQFVFGNKDETARWRLPTGRRIISLHYEDFLSCLNEYELNGRVSSEEFIKKESFGAFLYHVPDEALAALGCSMALAISTVIGPQVSNEERLQFLSQTQIIVRFVHVQPRVQMMEIKTGLVGKFLSVSGHVVKARPKRLRVATADFSCGRCGALTTHAFDQGKYSLPTKCSSKECRLKNFSIIRSTARYIDVQELRLQEAQDESTSQAGRTPRQLEVVLTHDLVDQCRAGDMVMVAARVSAINTAVAAGRGGKYAKENATYKLYLYGHSITTMSESHRSQQRSQVVWTQSQLQRIVQLAHADHRYFGLTERRAFPFDLLVHSLCPSIIGHDEVKAGLLLCLFGGTPPSSQMNDKSNTIRCNSHILIVGDPGMGKSQMLLAASQLAARSVFVGGNTSSATGLTVTLTKEERGEAGIEAGALVLADQGICCIDEFDKMAKNHHDGLLEAMEQQQVSIAKAGVVASLPTRCSVIAAANPKQGNYNMSKTVAENLNMAKPVLSRFDLVFILRDRADEEQDRLVSSNIMCLHMQRTGQTASTRAQDHGSTHTTGGQAGDRMSLSDRLRWVSSFQKQPLPAELVKDYITYAREYCKPKLTPEAAVVLKDYFMELRYPSTGPRTKDTVPITTRQLEALIRLCQARAKAALRDFVLEEDALDVVELMSKSVEQVHSDESGIVDRGRGGAGGASNRKMKKAFVNEVQRLVGVGNECNVDDLRRIADRVGCGLSEFSNLIEDLRAIGVLMKKPSGNFQVLS